MKWQKSELDFLIANYKILSLKDIQYYLYIYFWSDRTVSAIKVKAHRLGISRIKK